MALQGSQRTLEGPLDTGKNTRILSVEMAGDGTRQEQEDKERQECLFCPRKTQMSGMDNFTLKSEVFKV